VAGRGCMSCDGGRRTSGRRVRNGHRGPVRTGRHRGPVALAGRPTVVPSARRARLRRLLRLVWIALALRASPARGTGRDRRLPAVAGVLDAATRPQQHPPRCPACVRGWKATGAAGSSVRSGAGVPALIRGTSNKSTEQTASGSLTVPRQGPTSRLGRRSRR
jgi:hypothetical protein